MRKLTAVLALGLMGLAAAPGAAQEVQVPLDVEGRVDVVDAELARQAGLWVAEYPGFQEARLFRGADGGLVLEISELREGRLTRHRQPLTLAEADALRARVSAALASAPPPPVVVDQEGRYLLLAQTTLTGLVFYGWALPYSIGADEAGAGGLYLLTAGASFFVPFLLTADESVTMGMANLSRYGVSRGLVHGLMLADVIDSWGSGTDVCGSPDGAFCEQDEEYRLYTSLGLIGSIAEGIAGYAWAGGENMTAGTAHTIALGGDAGLSTGWLAAAIAGRSDSEVSSALGLGGSLLGIYGGSVLAKRRDHSWGDAQLMYAGGLLGGWTGLAFGAAAGASDELTAATTLVGGWIGAVVTDALVRDTEFSAGQANLVSLSTFAGGLAGASLGVMADDPDIAAIGSAAGAIGGFAMGYLTFAPKAGAGSSTGRGPMSVSVHPEGVLGLLGAGSNRSRTAGLVSVSYRF
jgi:hypothetical protein